MNIRITRLTMTNFKCFREKEMNLDEDIITIRGRNGAGKTTIADAILFCLFGKNSEGQSDLELFKTREDGKVIPNLDHSVELVLETRESAGPMAQGLRINEITLRRSIKEVWIKKRGSEESVFKNNTVEYYVNAESYTKADYEKYISALVDERVFRVITNPNYFPSLKWQDQRNFLTAMVGTIEPECFADTDELKELVDYFDQHDEDIESYLKHLKYQIKQIKNKLDKIPVRLEEQNKALPESLDYDALQMELEQSQSRLKEIDEKIVAIKSGNGGDVLRKQIRNELTELQRVIDKIEDTERKAYNLRKQEHDNRIAQLSNKFNETVNNQRLMEQTIEADKRIMERCETSIKEFDVELQKLRDNWPNRKFEADPSATYCPTCGQVLPDELAADRIKSMRDNFNKALEAEKQSLRDKAAKVKQSKEDAERELQISKDKLNEHTEAVANMKEDINTIFSQKAKLEKEQWPDFETHLRTVKQHRELLQNREELRKKLDSVGIDEDSEKQLAELEAKRVEYVDVLQKLNTQLATRQQYDKIQGLIAGIEHEQKDLVKQLSELEKKEDIARQYQFRQNQLLEERINKHFSLVQWKLFRTVNNGGDSFEEPFCECYVGGIPYHAGLNQAMRLNAGLDICEALCKFYNVSAPIVIDNAESNLNIYSTTGQQLRLQVYESDLILV